MDKNGFLFSETHKHTHKIWNRKRKKILFLEKQCQTNGKFHFIRIIYSIRQALDRYLSDNKISHHNWG